MQFMQKEFDVEIEEHLAAIRIRRASNSMHPVDLMQNEMGIADEEFGYQTGFEPFDRVHESTKQDPLLPGELRKLLNKNEPEMQNLFAPIFDEASRQQVLDMNEIKLKLFEAKWSWYKNKTLSQQHITTKELAGEQSIYK